MNSFYKVDRAKVVHEVFDEEIVIVHLDTGSYYSVQAVAAQIWLQIVNEASRDEILRMLSRRYLGDPEQIVREANDFLEDLTREKLVQAVEHGAPGDGDPTPIATQQTERFSRPTIQKYADMEKLLLIDPIHQVDDTGWPNARVAAAKK